MSLRDYLTCRRLEKEFLEKYDPNKVFYGNPIQYLEGLREGKRNSIKRSIKRSLTILVTLATLYGSIKYVFIDSNEEYTKMLDEVVKKADLDGDGKISGSREMAKFFNNIPYPAKYFIRP